MTRCREERGAVSEVRCRLVGLSLCVGTKVTHHRERRATAKVRVWCMPHCWPSPRPALKNRKRHLEFIPWMVSLSRLRAAKMAGRIKGFFLRPRMLRKATVGVPFYSDCICHKRLGKKKNKNSLQKYSKWIWCSAFTFYLLAVIKVVGKCADLG